MLLKNLVAAKRAHNVASESLRSRAEHEQKAMENEQTVENGDGGLVGLTMT